MIDQLPNFFSQRIFILTNFQWAGILITLFFGYLVKLILSKYISYLLNRIFVKKELRLSEKQIKKISFSLSLIGFSFVWLTIIPFLKFADPILHLFKIFGTVLLNSGILILAYHIIDIVCSFLEQKALETENKFDDILIPLLRKTFKTFLIITGVIIIGDSLTLDVKSIVAGLGIGGIAFALAAKDTIANLFGSLTIILDRPFQIGDWVVIDGTIEGSVEEVGLRSCRIRTFQDSLITLPNGKLTNADINNYGRRKFRRLNTKLGVEYDTTPESIEEFCDEIKKLILNHPKTKKDGFYVYFNEMGDFSLNILLSLLWAVKDKQEELEQSHYLYLEILKLGKKLNINFAFPTQTLHIEK